jgi:ABC-type transport system substrate-binding protein
VRTARIVTPRVMQLTLRANEPKLADAEVRKAILGLLDVDLLAAVGAGSDNTVTLDQAQIRSPSDPGYEPTAPPAMTTAAALGLFTAAGLRVESGTETSPASPAPAATSSTTAPVSTGPPEVIRGRISKDGKQLSLVVGVASNDPTSVAVANTAADQLRNVGIAATVLPLDPVTLYRDALSNHQVDAIVGWHQAGGNLATLLASRYGCPALQSTAVPTANAPTPVAASTTQPPAGPGTTSPTPMQPATSTPPTRTPEPGALVQAPSNLTGICDRSIQSNIDAALNGTKNINEVITAVEPRLWNMSTVLPILQDTTIVAAGPSVQNVSLSGTVPVGIVGDAGQWIKTGP